MGTPLPLGMRHEAATAQHAHQNRGLGIPDEEHPTHNEHLSSTDAHLTLTDGGQLVVV